MNFFNWIREGVRQAVLYGVHDAVGELGPPPSGQDMNERILHLLRTSPEGEIPRLDAPSAARASSESGWAAPWATSRPRWKPASKTARYNLCAHCSFAPFDVRWEE